MLLEAKNGGDPAPEPPTQSGLTPGKFFLLGVLSTVVGLTLIVGGPAAAQRSSSSGPGRGADEYYAPYRGNPEDEPRSGPGDNRDFPDRPLPGLEDAGPSAPETWVLEESSPQVEPQPPAAEVSGGWNYEYNNDPGYAALETLEPGPTGQVSERSEMLFPNDPDDPDYDKFPPADLPRPEEYPDLTVVPLPPLVPPPAASQDRPGSEAAGGSERERPAAEAPAGAAPALSVYPEESRSALPKNAVPGLVTHPGDVALLEKLRKNNAPAGALNWGGGAELSGPGLQADAEGRLSGLSLDKLGLSRRLDLTGAEGLLEVKSVGNPLTGLRLGGLASLRSLGLAGANLNRLERGTLAGLSGLTNLDLTDSGLEKIDPKALAALKSLESLDLSGNQLEQVGKGWFTGLDSLETLNLNNNNIYEVKWGSLSSLTGLVTLQLAGNRLTEINGGFFPGLTGLEVLYLENNRLTHLTQDALAGLLSLKYIDLSNNYLKSMPSLSHLENLSGVDLSGNCLSLGAMKDILAGLPENTNLHLKRQEQVYFGLRVQLLPQQDHYLIPAGDAFIDDIPSHGRILGPNPAGASYTPPEAAGQPGRLTFHQPGLYTLLLTNSGLGDSPDLSAATGAFLVVDVQPEAAEAAQRLGRWDLVAGLVQALASRGFVEAPASHPKRITALKAIFGPRNETTPRPDESDAPGLASETAEASAPDQKPPATTVAGAPE